MQLHKSLLEDLKKTFLTQIRDLAAYGDTPVDSSSWTGIFANDFWNRGVPTTEDLLVYRDFFVRRMKEERQVRFVNASEGGILSEVAEVLTLRDALHQTCDPPIDAESILESCHRKQTVTLRWMLWTIFDWF